MIRIVGAGFSGLTTAYFLVLAGQEVEIFEAGDRIGGLIQSLPTEYGLVETGANGVLNSALFERVARDVGCELQAARKDSRRRYIWRAGQPRQWPLTILETLMALVKFLTAGWWGRGRAPLAGESIRIWGERTLGIAATRHLLEPALQGIYAGDGDRLSATLILSRFFGPRDPAPKSKLRGTVAPRGGMGEFLSRLADWLRAKGVKIHLGACVTPAQLGEWKREELLLCTSVATTADLLSLTAPELSRLLRDVETIPVTTVTLFYPKDSPRRVEGFGCLFPRDSGFSVLGILFNGFIFDHRTDQLSETWIFRGVDLPDAALGALIARERAKFVGQEIAPLAMNVTRWPRALPHYALELEKSLPAIRAAAADARVTLMGNYLGTLGLSRLLLRSQATAAKFLKETR